MSIGDALEGLERGGWFKELGGKDLEAWAKLFSDESTRAKALLLGRRTDAWFAKRWNTRTGASAERMNGLPKYVVSSTGGGKDEKESQLGHALKKASSTSSGSCSFRACSARVHLCSARPAR